MRSGRDKASSGLWVGTDGYSRKRPNAFKVERTPFHINGDGVSGGGQMLAKSISGRSSSPVGGGCGRACKIFHVGRLVRSGRPDALTAGSSMAALCSGGSIAISKAFNSVDDRPIFTPKSWENLVD